MQKNSLSVSDKFFVLLVSFFCVLLVITNMLGIKIFKAPFGDFALTTGLLTYPLTFIVSDTVTEVYGKKAATFMIYLGFAFSLIMYCIVQLALALPPHHFWWDPMNTLGYLNSSDYQNAFQSVFNHTGIILFASLTAYISAQLLDIYLFEKLKKSYQRKTSMAAQQYFYGSCTTFRYDRCLHNRIFLWA